ncbi:MAG TPA: phosphopentomutase [Candidatus Onthousia faecavium]|nr:phosphopentomutase [Candidatus Onthousia faecavium]
MKFKRIFLMVLDSLGVGEASDAATYGDSGANTLGHIKEKCDLFVPNLAKIGFLNTLNMDENPNVDAYYTIARPNNAGKDTLAGHYEMMGIISNTPFKTFNENGFPIELIDEIEKVTERRVIGNKCSNDNSIINELGERQLDYGSLIVYTSADSDLQIASHEDVVSPEQLYSYCEKVRELTKRDEFLVGRVIARPFVGSKNHFRLDNAGRKDFPVDPPKRTILDELNEENYNVIAIGKMNDIFSKDGINKSLKASNNLDAINKLTNIMDKNFTGLCMVNLCDFDSLYGHTRDIEGYAKAIEELDVEMPLILNKLNVDDLFIITADHGNDPTFRGNDHTRENVPLIFYSRSFKTPKRLEIQDTLAVIGATIADNFDIEMPEIGTSILEELE